MTPNETPHPSLRRLFYNHLSLAGLALFVICTSIGVPLVLVDAFSKQTNPYAGIMTYAILPGIAVMGLGIAVIGALLESRRIRRFPGTPPPQLPRIDLNEPKQRLIFSGVLAVGTITVVLLSVTGYQAYHFTESVKFCGEVCHDVMEPEYTAYQHSPHARVACVECHVGSGAEHYLRSKATGAYQVYSLALHKYNRPIESPVKNLRPATETCEQCHWPEKFFGSRQITLNRFLADEANSPWQMQMLMKVGGGDPKAGQQSGIHWHMNISRDIFYAATDAQRQIIPYVKAVDKSGKVTEYMSEENPLSPADLAKTSLRKMDCVDCHNRPTHIFKSPEESVNQSLVSGRMETSLPYLKREAMRLLSATYANRAEALNAITKELPQFYEKNYPKLSQEKGAQIQQAVAVVKELYAENVFPLMRTDWRSHPNHAGHLNSDGCFRCHDGLHKSKDGRIITQDCNACHVIFAQGNPRELTNVQLTAQKFRHPVDVGVDVTQMKCSACHTGTTGL